MEHALISVRTLGQIIDQYRLDEISGWSRSQLLETMIRLTLESRDKNYGTQGVFSILLDIIFSFTPKEKIPDLLLQLSLIPALNDLLIQFNNILSVRPIVGWDIFLPHLTSQHLTVYLGPRYV